MSEKKSFLPSVEIIIILVFFLSFITWAASKCNTTKLQYQAANETPVDQSASEEAATPEDTSADLPTSTTPATTTSQPSTTNATTASTPNISTPPPAAPPKVITQTVYATRLFVNIEGLNLRNGPHLDSSIVRKLPLHHPVTFLNEVTPFTQEISMGDYIANEPWIRIQDGNGNEGWVYGAGVEYYKKAVEFIEEEE